MDISVDTSKSFAIKVEREDYDYVSCLITEVRSDRSMSLIGLGAESFAVSLLIWYTEPVRALLGYYFNMIRVTY
jgi:hypothetical protein